MKDRWYTPHQISFKTTETASFLSHYKDISYEE